MELDQVIEFYVYMIGYGTMAGIVFSFIFSFPKWD